MGTSIPDSARTRRERPAATGWRAGLAIATLACLRLGLLACDATEPESLSQRAYRRAMVDELCAPGEFYSECMWSRPAYCHAEMPLYVATCIEKAVHSERVRPSAALHDEIVDCVFYVHFMNPVVPIERRAACVDPKRWRHVPPGRVDILARARERWRRKDRKKAQPQPAPELLDAAPEPTGEPLPGRAPTGAATP